MGNLNQPTKLAWTMRNDQIRSSSLSLQFYGFHLATRSGHDFRFHQDAGSRGYGDHQSRGVNAGQGYWILRPQAANERYDSSRGQDSLSNSGG